jgi:hypothetical protein
MKTINPKKIETIQPDSSVLYPAYPEPTETIVPITNEKMGLMRMMDIMQMKAAKYAKSSLMKDVQAFLYNYDPTWTVARVEVELFSICLAKDWATVVRLNNVDYVKLTANGFVARGSVFELISG